MPAQDAGAPGPPTFPDVGETLSGFRLIWELGRGAAGKVFLAAQPSLADRPVVLKITRLGRDEHLSLARLQHMYIVPLYSAHVLEGRGLQVLCMPFLGGATLTQVLDVVKEIPVPERTGKNLTEALDQIERRLPVASAAEGPFRDFLARSSYVAAICSIGACLADGLQYAHDRDVVHMDIKPSNVLLADDGQPMLLDFHLARKSVRPGGSAPTWMGGTPEHMAPEQVLAVECVRQGRTIAAAVDGRADLYSLGLLLYEALGGPCSHADGHGLPSASSVQPPRLRRTFRHHSQVPVSRVSRSISRCGLAGPGLAVPPCRPASPRRAQPQPRGPLVQVAPPPAPRIDGFRRPPGRGRHDPGSRSMGLGWISPARR